MRRSSPCFFLVFALLITVKFRTSPLTAVGTGSFTNEKAPQPIHFRTGGLTAKGQVTAIGGSR